jgi:hypothetical protein
MATRRNFFATLASTSLGAAFAFRAGAAQRSATSSAAPSPGMRFLAPSGDFQAALQEALDDLDPVGGEIQLAPGSYGLAKPLTLARDKATKLVAERLPIIRISGYGATFNQTIQVAGRAFHVAGLRVVGADGPGFAFTRSQVSHFTDLQAIDCRQSGFVLGGAEGAQVAFGLWVNCLALGCTKNGWELVADDPSSWVNANSFLNCIARSNGGAGLLARSSQNRVNYNHFFGLQIEGNGGKSVDLSNGARDNDLHGGHFVDRDKDGVGIDLGDGHNQMFGGRAVGLVNGGSAVIMGSPAYRGKGMVVRMPAPG